MFPPGWGMKRVTGSVSAMDKRKLPRKNLVYYLKVFNRESGELLGHLVDITQEGLMLVSENTIPENTLFSLRINFPRDIFGEETLDFSALSLWCRPDVNPLFYDTGFRLMDISLDRMLLIKRLMGEYGFTE